MDIEIAIRILTTLATVSATLIGFVIVALVFFINKFMKLFGSTRYMEKDKYEVKKRRNIFYWFLILLLLILAPLFGFGFYTISNAIDTMAIMPSSIGSLTPEIESGVANARFFFGWLLFDVASIVVIILISGYLYEVMSERYEGRGEMKDIELQNRRERQPYIPEYLAWKSAKLGRNLFEVEREDYIKRIEIAELFKKNGQEDEILLEFNEFMIERKYGKALIASEEPKEKENPEA